MLSKVIEACQYLLNNYSEAQECKEYLSKRLNESSQELFQFGYFPNIQNIEALTSLVDENILNKPSLFGLDIFNIVPTSPLNIPPLPRRLAFLVNTICSP